MYLHLRIAPRALHYSFSMGNCPVTVLSMQMELVSVTLGHNEKGVKFINIPVCMLPVCSLNATQIYCKRACNNDTH